MKKIFKETADYAVYISVLFVLISLFLYVITMA